MRRILKISAIVVATFTVLLLAGYVYLNSESGGRWALSMAERKLAGLGYSLKADALKISLFRHIQFTNLRLSKTAPEDKLDALIAKGDIQYQIGLFPLAVRVQTFEIGSTTVTLESSATKPEPEDLGNRSLQTTFREIFDLIPMDVQIDDLRVGPVTAQILQKKPSTTVEPASEQEIRFKDLTLSGSLGLTSDWIRTDLKIEVPKSEIDAAHLRQNVSAALSSNALSSQLTTDWNLEIQLKTLIENQSEGVRFQPEAIQFQIELQNLVRKQSAPNTPANEIKIELVKVLAGPVSPTNLFHWKVDVAATNVRTASGAPTSNSLKKIPPILFSLDLETSQTLNFLRANFFLKEQNREPVRGDVAILDGEKFFSGHVRADLSPQFFENWGALLPPSFRGPLASSNRVQAQAEFGIDLLGSKPNHLLAIPWQTLAEQNLKASAIVKAETISLPQFSANETTIDFTWSQKKSEAASSAKTSADLNLQSTLIRAPSIKGPLPLTLRLQVPNVSAQAGTYDLNIKLLEQEAVRSEGTWNLKDSKTLDIKAKANVQTQHLPSSLPIYKLLSDFGQPKVSVELVGDLGWPLAQVPAQTNFKGVIQGDWERKSPAKSLDPGSGTFTIDLQNSANQRSADVSLSAKDLQKVDLARVGTVDIKIDGHQTGGLDSKNLRARVSGNISALKFLGAQASLNDSTKELTTIRFDASLVGSRQGIELPSAKVTLGENVLNAALTGKALFLEKEVQIEGMAGIDLQKQMTLMGEHKMRGQLNIPISAYVRADEWINVSGQLKFANFDYSGPKIQLGSVSGLLPFQEQIIVKNQKFSFAELLQLNTFTRVTFDRVEPLLINASPLIIQKIVIEDKTYGPLVVHGLLRQNLLLGQKFDLSLGQGQLGGEFYLDLYPRTLSFGLLTRLTGVRPDEVLPRSFRGQGDVSNDPISARTALVYDINSRSLEGKVDVTQIGKSQLLTMINVMDPEYRDDRLNQMRTVLSIAYPTSVAAQFAQGYMDLDVTLNIGKPIPKIRGVAISPFLTDISRKIRNQVKEVTSE